VGHGVTRGSRPRWASRLLACVLPPRDVEAAIGDLEEEYALRCQATSRASTARWYWGQVVRSVPVFAWASVRRGGWASTLAVALGACVVQAAIEFATKFAMSAVVAPDTRLPAILTLVVSLPTLVLLSFLAARIRPGGATMLTTVILAAIVFQLAVKTNAGLPVWNQIAALVVAPSAAFAGGILSLKVRQREIHSPRTRHLR
jgi:hypothetical protein